MSDKVRCSVIIPSYNSESTIVACLESVLNQDLAEPFEVIVVDSSSDRTPALVQQHFPMVHLIHREQRMGSGTARNLGVAIARGDILAFTDSDCIVESDWLRRMCERHDQFPDCAAVGGPIVNGNPESLISWAGYLAEFSESLPHKFDREVNHIPTSNLSFKKYVFEQYGHFPGDGIVKGVDRLFNWRIRRKGEKILYACDIRVAHCHRIKLKDYLVHQFAIGRATVQILRRTDLPGNSVIGHQYLAVLLLPGFLLAKLTCTFYRLWRWHPRAYLDLFPAFPFLLVGLLWWLSGMAYQLRQTEDQSRYCGR